MTGRRHPLIPLIEICMQEPQFPRLSEVCIPPLSGSPSSPIGRACVAYARAVNAVATSADRINRDGWMERRQGLARWLQILRENPPAAAAALTSDASPADLDDVIVGPRWQECIDDMQQMHAWAAIVATETTHKAVTINNCSKIVHAEFDSSRQRMTAIVADAEPRIAASPDDRDAIIRQAQDEVAIVSDTTVAAIHAQIRVVLDLDETLAPISVEDWVARDG